MHLAADASCVHAKTEMDFFNNRVKYYERQEVMTEWRKAFMEMDWSPM
jgi:hypothetical protein